MKHAVVGGIALTERRRRGSISVIVHLIATKRTIEGVTGRGRPWVRSYGLLPLHVVILLVT